MKTCVIGAGVSGLAVAKLLNDNFDVEILEADEQIGGIAKTKTVDGIAYHMIGGHCFNSNYKEVRDFVFSIYEKDKWNLKSRTAKIFLDGHFISYPIEFSVPEIAKFDRELAFNITNDFFCARYDDPKNLEEWFLQKFGETLAKKYFLPYSKKIWGEDPAVMSYLWVEDKLPSPNKKDFFESLLKKKQDDMPHVSFYYPITNDQNTFLHALAAGLNILTSYKVNSIEQIGGRWCINGNRYYDTIISTIPLNEIPFILNNTPLYVKNIAEKLRYNKITTMLWSAKDTEQTWSYFPAENTIFHRHIHIGNFFSPKWNYIITEALGIWPYEQMVSEGRKFEYLIQPLDFNISNHAYVVYDKNYEKSKKCVLNYLNDQKIYSLGRFGEWEYYNMDVCIKSATSLFEKIVRENLK
ncbi:MAG: NAD(P)-binding protein [Deltaproteobacteria bacterium]|nr:NAD(P)-binding protein [Deltaproteobacteria bacterium]